MHGAAGAPGGARNGSWKASQRTYEEGGARAVGVVTRAARPR
jgi:hypothetical protein